VESILTEYERESDFAVVLDWQKSLAMSPVETRGSYIFHLSPSITIYHQKAPNLTKFPQVIEVIEESTTVGYGMCKATLQVLFIWQNVFKSTITSITSANTEHIRRFW
jgi:hypothetical protein